MRAVALITFLLFLVYALFVRWYFVCEIRGLCGKQATSEAPVDNRLKTLTLEEGDSILLSGYDQFAFDSASVAPRLNDNNQLFIDTLAALLKADTGKNLKITGRYLPGEKELRPGGFFENIGVARADRVRRLLMRRGIPERRMTLDNGPATDPGLLEPLAFELYKMQQTPGEYENLQFVFTNMTFSDANFAYNSDEFKPGDAFTHYADSVKTYLGLNEGKKMTIIGHTDNIGSDRYNQELGLRRAKSARDYFKKLGVSNEIKVESKGKKRPAASNNTPEGRQKNRRVNFILE